MLNSSAMIDRLKNNGFNVLGSGLFSTVLAHPKNPDIAIKVSREQDTWPDFVAWATRAGYAGKQAPKVFSLKHFDGWYVAVMERLVDTLGGIKHEYYQHHQDIYSNPYPDHGYDLKSDSRFPDDLVEFYRDMVAMGFDGDMHGGNIMVRKDGQIVVTDPSSNRSKTKPRIRRGQVI